MFSLFCQTCKKQNEPYLDKDTDIVYCAECDAEMQVNPFTKTQMRSMKQFKSSAPSSKSIKCASCKKLSNAIVLNKDLCCGICKKPHSHLTSYFKQVIMEQIKKGSDIGGNK